MNTINVVAAGLCVALSIVVAAQSFCMSAKMTGTAKPVLKFVVGISAFLSVAVPAATLGGDVDAYWLAVGILLAVSALLGLMLRKWKAGMPREYDTDSAPLGDR